MVERPDDPARHFLEAANRRLGESTADEVRAWEALRNRLDPPEHRGLTSWIVSALIGLAALAAAAAAVALAP
jgi:hypothetical protein